MVNTILHVVLKVSAPNLSISKNNEGGIGIIPISQTWSISVYF